jgi:hypothetical protein
MKREHDAHELQRSPEQFAREERRALNNICSGLAVGITKVELVVRILRLLQLSERSTSCKTN